MIRTIRLVERLMALGAGIALFIMMGLTFVDVVGRYGLHASVFGSAEMVEVLMVVMIFAGVALVTLNDDHISVTMFDHLMPASADRPLRWFRGLFGLVCYVAVTIALWEIARDAYATGKTSVVLQLRAWPMVATAVVLSAIGCVLYAIALWLTDGRPRRLSPAKPPEDQPAHAGGGL